MLDYPIVKESEMNYKNKSYYENSREEVLHFIPSDAKIILEVGLGYGNFAALLKSKRNIEIWGIEIDPKSAMEARKKVDVLIEKPFEDAVEELPHDKFDVVVFNDVLEHLIDPFEVLRTAKSLLKLNGFVIASIPNVRYWGNIKHLLKKKDWKYEQSGIRDYTHIRFFTKLSMTRMFEQTGYFIKSITGINETKSINYRIINTLFLNNLADARYLQYVCVAVNASDVVT